MQHTIKNRIRKGRIVQVIVPVFSWKLVGDQRRALRPLDHQGL